MKNVLIQLDTDRFASAFDAITAYDAGADVVLSYGAIDPPHARSLTLGAVFTRGIPDLNSIAVWIGGSDIEAGESVLQEIRRSFFGPFKISIMIDSNGCNTTASTAIARLAQQTDLRAKDAVVLGMGPVGIRAAALLAGEGCRTLLAALPAQIYGDHYDLQKAAASLRNAKKTAEKFELSLSDNGGTLQLVNLSTSRQIGDICNSAEIVISAGAAGLRILPATAWKDSARLNWLIDFNLTEPIGVEGIKPGDNFAEHGRIKAFGALAIGNAKMKVHKACIAELFKRNDLFLDAHGIFQIAKELT